MAQDMKEKIKQRSDWMGSLAVAYSAQQWVGEG